MTKRSFLAAALTAAPFLTTRAKAADEPLPPGIGSMAAQVAGRVNIGLDGIVEVFVYFMFVDGVGLGSDLFEGQPNQHTAHFTLRADRLRPVFTQNGDITHVTFEPAPGGQGFYRIFYNPRPTNRDLTRPETFSQGTQIAAFRTRRTQATLIPGALTQVTGTIDLVEHADFTFRDRTFNVRDIYLALSCVFHARPFTLSDIGVTTFSVPLGGYLIKAG